MRRSNASSIVTRVAILPVAIVFSILASAQPFLAQDAEVSAAADTARQPLFESHGTLTLTISAPLKEIFKERDEESTDHPATVIIRNGADDGDIVIPAELRTRGNFRLQRRICPFPPVRLDLPRDSVGHTVFAGQDKLKMVTHCRPGNRDAEQRGLLEYLSYRMYNELTPLSFRVRLARVTWVDTAEDEPDSATAYAFFIEDEDKMAARSGWEVLEVPVVPPEQMDPVQLNLFEVFQYMIGNTDWAAFQAEPDEDKCCHNARIVGSMAGVALPVPYDFDWAGLVDPPYAKPNPDLGIRRVRDRLYRGLCRPQEELDATLEQFKQRKDVFYQLVREQEGLTDKFRERTLKYLEEFFETIEDPGRVRSRMVRDCRG